MSGYVRGPGSIVFSYWLFVEESQQSLSVKWMISWDMLLVPSPYTSPYTYTVLEEQKYWTSEYSFVAACVTEWKMRRFLLFCSLLHVVFLFAATGAVYQKVFNTSTCTSMLEFFIFNCDYFRTKAHMITLNVLHERINIQTFFTICLNLYDRRLNRICERSGFKEPLTKTCPTLGFETVVNLTTSELTLKGVDNWVVFTFVMANPAQKTSILLFWLTVAPDWDKL